MLFTRQLDKRMIKRQLFIGAQNSPEINEEHAGLLFHV
jgi:hypothetical protein